MLEVIELAAESALSERLKAARAQSGKTQEEVAEQMGVTSHAVYYWESGRANPSHEHLVRLSEVYGVSVDWLLGGDEKQVPGEIDLEDPELDLFFRGPWHEMSEEEREFIRSAVRMATENRRRREQG